MPALTPQFLMDFESDMQTITESEYKRLLANLWWRNVATPRPTTSRRSLVAWLLSTAMIREQAEGSVEYEDLISKYTEMEVKEAGAALKLKKSQFEDSDGDALDLGGQWASDIGAYMAYWPQKRTAYAMKNGHTASLFTGYDTKAFFATDHPVNPFRASAGNYANLFTGAPAAASGNTPAYPGALPIDDSVTVDVAIVNLAKLVAYVASIRQANGEDPRGLRLKALVVPPRMFPRAVQLTSAKFIAQAATGGVASADVEMLIKALGFATPIQADELAGFESDTTYFASCEQISTSRLGGLVYLERQPFKIDYFGPQTALELARRKEYEWLCDGRNSINPGHPYLLHKIKAA